ATSWRYTGCGTARALTLLGFFFLLEVLDDGQRVVGPDFNRLREVDVELRIGQLQLVLAGGQRDLGIGRVAEILAVDRDLHPGPGAAFENPLTFAAARTRACGLLPGRIHRHLAGAVGSYARRLGRRMLPGRFGRGAGRSVLSLGRFASAVRGGGGTT